MSAILELDAVEAGYGRVPVLRGITLAVAEGEALAVLGANGAGKTTTLRAICGLVRRTGQVLLDGRPAPRTPEGVARAGVAHVPEGRGTFDELTVRENLRLGAYTRRGARAAEERRVLDLFPRLAERLDQQAGTLSGGEQQLLALARGLMLRPRLLMLDEPSLGLAPRVAAEVFRAVRALNAEEGLAVLLVEQNAAAALGVARRAVVLEAGRVALEGTSRELVGDDAVRRTYLGY